MCIFNLFLRLLTTWVLYWDWGDRRGLVAVTLTKNTEGGSVRSGSVLTHYPGEDHLRELNTVMMTRSDPAAAHTTKLQCQQLTVQLLTLIFIWC